MTQLEPPFDFNGPPAEAAGTPFGARLVLEQRRRAHERRLYRTEQVSDLNSPEERIRAWEKLHRLQLPQDPAHAILDLVAINTRLTLEQVLEAQARRRDSVLAPRATTSREGGVSHE